MAKDNPRAEDPADVTQLRAELALLRSMVQQQLDRDREAEADKKKFADYLTWVGKTNAERTQLAADVRFAGAGGEPWKVSLVEHPTVVVPAHSQYEAIGRYQEVCGITGTSHEFVAAPVTVAASAG